MLQAFRGLTLIALERRRVEGGETPVFGIRVDALLGLARMLQVGRARQGACLLRIARSNDGRRREPGLCVSPLRGLLLLCDLLYGSGADGVRVVFPVMAGWHVSCAALELARRVAALRRGEWSVGTDHAQTLHHERQLRRAAILVRSAIRAHTWAACRDALEWALLACVEGQQLAATAVCGAAQAAATVLGAVLSPAQLSSEAEVTEWATMDVRVLRSHACTLSDLPHSSPLLGGGRTERAIDASSASCAETASTVDHCVEPTFAEG